MIISEHGFRLDGRRPDQIRNISCKLGVNKEADGSAYIEQGNTKVLCAVYGPREAKHSRQMEERCAINCQFSLATFSGTDRRNRPRGDRKTGENSRLLAKTFESVILSQSFPRSEIDIYCEVIQGDGSHLAACVNAACLALVDAGIPMKGLVSAVSCGVVGGDMVLDLSNREETDLVPRTTVATVSARDEIVLMELQNRVHVDHMEKLFDQSIKTCAMVHECMHAAAREYLARTSVLL